MAVINRQETPARRPGTSGGTPTGASGPTEEQLTTAQRLEKQRQVAEEKANAEDRGKTAAEKRGIKNPLGTFTAVSVNSLPHRRNGIMFGSQPVSVNTKDWSDEERDEFFSDSLLMIVAGKADDADKVADTAAQQQAKATDAAAKAAAKK